MATPTSFTVPKRGAFPQNHGQETDSAGSNVPLEVFVEGAWTEGMTSSHALATQDFPQNEADPLLPKNASTKMAASPDVATPPNPATSDDGASAGNQQVAKSVRCAQIVCGILSGAGVAAFATGMVLAKSTHENDPKNGDMELFYILGGIGGLVSSFGTFVCTLYMGRPATASGEAQP